MRLPTWRLRFRITHGRRYGSANSRTGTINLSLPVTMDTVLHELAHLQTPRHGHDKVWRQRAKNLGATWHGRPVRLYADEFIEEAAR